VLRKILEAFRILSIVAIKIDAKLPLTNLQLQQKCDKYAIRLAMLAKNYLIKMRISSSFISQYSTKTEINKKKYLDWNENKSIESIDANLLIKTRKSRKRNRKYSTQVHRVLNEVKDIVNYVSTFDLLY